MSLYKSSTGVALTQGLFYEWNNPDAIYTMRDSGLSAMYIARSGKGYKSLPYIFRNSCSEYDCAIEVLGSWEHWKKLCKLDWFMTGAIMNNNNLSGLNDWRTEKEIAEESKAKKVLMEAIKTGDIQAAKFIYDKKTKTSTAKAGRPEKKVPTKTTGAVLTLAKRLESK
jgi:hypothetical protein